MSPWDMVAALGIYTDEQIDEMTWAECEEILNQGLERINNNTETYKEVLE